MKKIDLNGHWMLEGNGPDGDQFKVEASVPGSALNEILKLEENAEYKNIFWRDNADHFLKYENYSYKYTKVFSVDELSEAPVLTFECLDTYCDVFLNGRHLANCDNGHIFHSFDVADKVIKGENKIEIYFYSPITAVAGKRSLNAAFTNERLHTRRMQCTYGWDWTMRFVTVGIGNAYISLCDKKMNIKSAYVYTLFADSESAQIGIDAEIRNHTAAGMLTIRVSDKDGNVVYSHQKYVEEDFVRFSADIACPDLWYPMGYGKQPLYTLEIDVNGNLAYKTQFGIRTVRILELEDKPGTENYDKCVELKKTPFSLHYDKNEKFSGFILVINGVKIMCKGANWVPCEPFTTGNTDKRITEILELAAECGVNMIRVWGGGSFETEHFYNECSRLGILVTQDFLMACGQYPEDEQWFLDQLAREAEHAACLIRNKACLVWWTGDNENAVEGCDTDTNYMGRSSAYKAIAPVLYRLDPHRRFLPSSPYGGKNYASNTAGTTHNTQYLSYFFDNIEQSDLKDYKEYFKLYNARFIAEEPCFGAVNYDSLKTVMTDEDIFGDDGKMWIYHSKTNPALKRELFDYACEFAEKILGKFKNGEDKYFKLKYIQCEWIRVTLERARREKWFCSGLIFWMLNDCWPAASGWALIDYYNKPKAGFYAFKRAAKPVMLSLDKEDGKYKIYLCCDGSCSGKVTVSGCAIDASGNKCGEISAFAAELPDNATVKVLEIDADKIPAHHILTVQAECDGKLIDRAFYKDGDLAIFPCEGIQLVSAQNGVVEIKANRYIQVAELSGDAVFEDNYFTMLPGETRKVAYRLLSDNTDISVAAYTV